MIVSFNSSAEKLFGYEKIDILGKNVKVLMDDAIAKHHDTLVSNFNKDGIKRLIGTVRYEESISCLTLNSLSLEGK
jgi:PAS domain S-box-containing protein